MQVATCSADFNVEIVKFQLGETGALVDCRTKGGHVMALPRRVADRIVAGLKRFQTVLQAAKARDVNESDTVVIVTDVLQEIFGYDKYSEITSEQKIRGTYCDLAIKIENSPTLLIEVKAIGLELKDNHVRQVVDYAANLGVDWVVLTNGIRWNVYKIAFGKPIEHELVVHLDLLSLNPKSDADLEMVSLLAKEGWQKARLGDYHTQKQVLSRFAIAAIVLSDSIVDVIRRELRRASSGIRVESEEIRQVLRDEVLKREVLEGEKADLARRLINRSASKTLRTVTYKDKDSGLPADATTPPSDSSPPIPSSTGSA